MNRRDLENEFETKYNDYGKMLFKIAFLYMGNSSDAEDVLQDVFVKFLSSRHNFKDGEHEKAWFIRVTQNKCLDMLKRASNKNVPIEDIISLNYVENNDMSEIIEKVFSLPEKYKLSVILYYYNDYSVEEISKILKISKSAVKMRLKRSREILKLELEDYV
ncbi:MAG: RNA polymerase sigma factor [Clostridia bacterium]|nr:RNA polymerase sigma factor [Clostridia bacterium]